MDETQFKYGRSAPIPKSHDCGRDLPEKPHPEKSHQEKSTSGGSTNGGSISDNATGSYVASGVVASNILLEAAAIVRGNRNTVHGDKERSFTLIGQLWSAYLNGRVKLSRGAAISAIDVAQMMVLMKIARSIQGQAIRDHYVDAAGYAAIAGELALAEF